MIDYTAHLTRLMRDLTARVPDLSHIDPDRVLVFARHGRTGSAGPFATCHCLTLPTSEPGYYYWFDARTGEMTRRSPYFVTRSPRVTVGGRTIHYLISFTLPRYCDQRLAGSKKERFYPGEPDWVARLDTVVHELYHIDPARAGIRRACDDEGREAAGAHAHGFFEQVASIVRRYIGSRPDPALVEFLHYDFAGLTAKYGGVVGTTFRTFPSFPKRYAVPLDLQPVSPPCSRIQPIRRVSGPTAFTERDLACREFFATRRGARWDGPTSPDLRAGVAGVASARRPAAPPSALV